MTTQARRWSCDCVIEDFLPEIRRLYPDHDDFFEDELAHRLGLRRSPSMSASSWRKERLAFINASAEADSEYTRMQHEEEQRRLEARMPEVSDASGADSLKSERIQLKSERIQSRLTEVTGWTVAQGNSKLTKDYEFTSSRSAAAFCRFVATVADDLDLEPRIVHWGSRVEIATQSAVGGGVTDLDFDFARHIDG